ncbi:hypothetical protein VI08_20080 [Luteibacter yeojuensis]|uniref:Uncharacterized protein n=2 Tax=Luteibacter yeojuensis TaxID=345309 RepID=A0A0F3K4B6_9GAMM|nr:hypothetical protein VI08_20080 [Luteibacter yeojuensis]
MIVTAIEDGGLGHFDLIADPYARVAMVMGPLSLDEVGPGDKLQAFMNVDGDDKLIASHDITSSDLGQESPIFTLEADASEINKYPDGEYDFSYHVLYSNGRSDSSIEPLRVRIKRTIPGDPAEPSNPVNEALPLATVVPSPVPASATSATVTVPAWPNMAEGDIPTVDWERLHLVLPAVKAGEVGQPVSVVITKAQLEQVGGMQDLPVAYEIFDVVANHSGRSRYTLVDVEIEPPGALTAPRVREAVGGVLDPEAQGDTPFTIQIPTIGRAGGRNVSPGDVITALFEGRIPGTGASHRYVAPPYTVPGTIFDITIDLPVDEVMPLRGGTARVSYGLLPQDGGPVLPSRHLGLSIKGLPALLVAVTIPEDANQDDTLDLDTEVTDGATASIDYANMALDDYITLDLTGRRADGMADNDRKYRQVSKLGKQAIAIGSDYLQRLDGGTLELKYSVDSFDGQGAARLPRRAASLQAMRESEVRKVAVGSKGAEPKLPAPTVPDVVDGFLDPKTAETAVVVPHAVLEVNDGIDFTWTSKQSETGHLTVRNANVDLRFAIEGSLIKANEGNSVVVAYKRTRAGIVALSEPLAFRIETPVIGPPPLTLDVDANQDNVLELASEMPAGTTPHAIIPAGANLAADDTVQVIVDGRTADGTPALWESFPRQIPASEAGKAQSFAVPADSLRALSGGSATLKYRVKPFADPENPVESQLLTVQVRP